MEPQEPEGTVYVLKLSQSKYYVGYTKQEDVMDRVRDHIWKHETAAEWTKKYPVISLIQVIHNANLETERRTTLELMKKYGWQNVRGSIYCEVDMKEAPVELHTPGEAEPRLFHWKQLQADTQQLQNCLECNQPGHWARNCPNLHCRLCGQVGHMAKTCTNRATILCYQCGETGHLKRDCTLKEPRCLQCKKVGHFANSCPSSSSSRPQQQPILTRTFGPCRACGKNGHWQANCPTKSAKASSTV